ncbi:MAG: hypothetical protein HYS12_17330 [Planctomycetes bacterium]|nr:hypothetical protein [Planctomycetota bacterium]
MTPLGKCLVFYLKYPVEMDHLYWEPAQTGEKPELRDLEDAEKIRNMAEIVGEKATQEAVDFLEQCANKVQEYLLSLKVLKVVNRSRRTTMARNWGFQASVERDPWVAGGWFRYGVFINDCSGIIVPWLWRNGGREWEGLVKKVLRNRAHSGSDGELVSGGGSVALASIPILGEKQQGFDVDRDALVAKVVDCFAGIRADDVKAIAQNVGEEDEGRQDLFQE